MRQIEKIERRWHRGYELRLVPGAHDCDKKLTNLIYQILKEDFFLKGAEILETFPESPEEDKYKPKNKRAHVLGMFPNKEIREDVGEITFSEFRQREVVYFITHPYNNSRGINVETTIGQIRLFGRTLRDEDIRLKHLALVTPVGAYDLNHSVRRNKREGLIEGYRLKMYLEDLAREGYKEVITIASHSDTTKEEANALGMNFRNIDPFRLEFQVSSPRLGPFLYRTPENTQKRNEYNSRIKKLTPFVTYLKKEYKKIDDVYFIAADDGSASTIEQLAYACRGDKQNILAILKRRLGPSETEIYGVKSWSTAQLDDIKDKTCIIADDRRLSGGTANQVADALKRDYGAGKVVALIAQDMSFNKNIVKHTSIDKFVFLETNPNSNIANLKDPRIERLPMETTALLLAAEIFDSYVNRRDLGESKVR